ncbi:MULTISPECIES: hypothetical protein [Halorubrum]|jgi:hypothetical protein|uniref:DUF8053 domain-containing protein n=5 Tax=Halorubrum TaxID=56688 RepID=A0A8T8LMV3_9EURY|nr:MULTISPECIES: hypothetical protein [Halorubrum]TKX86148.1 hypothetical protein EXE43_09980 [Halorubrum sp. SS5]ELZ45647.1 hypothetical protein C464_12035 [Halorubrum coriense DSM 10284]KOX96962.1 hypothetical protein AMR74_05925 [Halorubrum tropicale]MDB2273013.1 hypothetical protein [Halorubrum ezzemoulense]MDB9235354.1 hypothetical protein [Halorubrum ezzemoulense]
MGFKSLVDRDGSGTVTIDKQHLELDGLVAEDGSIKEADAHTQRVGERAYLVRFPEDGEVPTLLELVGRA